MSRYALAIGVSVLALTAGSAFAQSTPPTTKHLVKPHHWIKPATGTSRLGPNSSPDHSADQLNAKELTSIQAGSPGGMMPAPAKKTTP